MPKMKTLNLNLSSNPNSCLLIVDKNRYRSLIDSGADCSIINKRIYNQIPNKPPLSSETLVLIVSMVLH